jgi:hypothetical protein
MTRSMSCNRDFKTAIVGIGTVLVFVTAVSKDAMVRSAFPAVDGDSLHLRPLRQTKVPWTKVRSTIKYNVVTRSQPPVD